MDKNEESLIWEWKEFGNVFKFLSTFSFSRENLSYDETDEGIQYIHYGDIHTTFESEILDFETEKRIPYLNENLIKPDVLAGNQFPWLEDGDLVIADASEDYAGLGECVEIKNIKNKKVIGGLHTFVARDKSGDTATGYRTYIFNNPIVSKEIKRRGQGISVYGISKSNLSTIKIPIPSIPEQEQIANLLALWDRAIYSTSELIKKYQKRQKWLSKNILSGNKRIARFKKSSLVHKTSLGLLPTDWKIKPLDALLNPVRNPLFPEPSVQYQQIGIRSHTKGIFYKEKVTGKELGDKRVFWVEPDCFVVNIVFAWEHAIAKTTRNEIGLIASHRFPMFKPKTGVMDLDYLLYFFKSARGKHLLGLASPGGAGRNKTLGQSEFIKLQIPVPEYEEQKAIANLLSTIDKEIDLHKKHLIQIRKQKKGLMQQLLTGKLRVPKKNIYE